MAKKFKYQEDMDIIKNEHKCDCPSKDLKAITPFEAYRYVFEDINHKSNFLPQLKDDPARFIDDNGKKKCNYLNLSMYSKIEGAKEKLGITMSFNGNDFKDFPIDFSKFSKIINGKIRRKKK